ncbi:unnamed protein product [Closterium sp. NIES-64]|nr:unnamed protein product [Closterium sp. NIES-64]
MSVCPPPLFCSPRTLDVALATEQRLEGKEGDLIDAVKMSVPALCPAVTVLLLSVKVMSPFALLSSTPSPPDPSCPSCLSVPSAIPLPSLAPILPLSLSSTLHNLLTTLLMLHFSSTSPLTPSIPASSTPPAPQLVEVCTALTVQVSASAHLRRYVFGTFTFTPSFFPPFPPPIPIYPALTTQHMPACPLLDFLIHITPSPPYNPAHALAHTVLFAHPLYPPNPQMPAYLLSSIPTTLALHDPSTSACLPFSLSLTPSSSPNHSHSRPPRLPPTFFVSPMHACLPLSLPSLPPTPSTSPSHQPGFHVLTHDFLFSHHPKPTPAGFHVLTHDFLVSHHPKPQQKLRFFSIRADFVNSAVTLVSPPQASILLNAKEVPNRTAIDQDRSPLVPSDVIKLLRLGVNILNLIGRLSVPYIFVVAVMAPTPLLPPSMLKPHPSQLKPTPPHPTQSSHTAQATGTSVAPATTASSLSTLSSTTPSGELSNGLTAKGQGSGGRELREQHGQQAGQEEEEEQEELLEGPVRVSLLCPISWSRMKVPVRDRACSHPQVLSETTGSTNHTDVLLFPDGSWQLLPQGVGFSPSPASPPSKRRRLDAAAPNALLPLPVAAAPTALLPSPADAATVPPAADATPTSADAVSTGAAAREMEGSASGEDQREGIIDLTDAADDGVAGGTWGVEGDVKPWVGIGQGPAAAVFHAAFAAPIAAAAVSPAAPARGSTHGCAPGNPVAPSPSLALSAPCNSHAPPRVAAQTAIHSLAIPARPAAVMPPAPAATPPPPAAALPADSTTPAAVGTAPAQSAAAPVTGPASVSLQQARTHAPSHQAHPPVPGRPLGSPVAASGTGHVKCTRHHSLPDLDANETKGFARAPISGNILWGQYKYKHIGRDGSLVMVHPIRVAGGTIMLFRWDFRMLR